MGKLIRRETYLSLFFRFLKEKELIYNPLQFSDCYKHVMFGKSNYVIYNVYIACNAKDMDDFKIILLSFIWEVMSRTLLNDKEYMNKLYSLIDDDNFKNEKKIKKCYLTCNMIHLSTSLFCTAHDMRNGSAIETRKWLEECENNILLP